MNVCCARAGSHHCISLSIQTGLCSPFRNLLCVTHPQSQSLSYVSLTNDISSISFVKPGLWVVKVLVFFPSFFFLLYTVTTLSHKRMSPDKRRSRGVAEEAKLGCESERERDVFLGRLHLYRAGAVTVHLHFAFIITSML